MPLCLPLNQDQFATNVIFDQIRTLLKLLFGNNFQLMRLRPRHHCPPTLDSNLPRTYCCPDKKKLKEQFDKTQSKVDFISEICYDLYGNAPTRDGLVQAMAARLDTKSELRTFASLGSKDYELLNPGAKGSIKINVEKLAQVVPPTSIPSEFWTCLTMLRMVCARRMEMGVRQIIGHFLSSAIVVARKIFDDERLVRDFCNLTNLRGICEIFPRIYVGPGRNLNPDQSKLRRGCGPGNLHRPAGFINLQRSCPARKVHSQHDRSSAYRPSPPPPPPQSQAQWQVTLSVEFKKVLAQLDYSSV